MTIKADLARFRDEESGAITVDWVVLTAALVVLSVGVFAAISGSTTTAVGTIETQITSVDPAG